MVNNKKLPLSEDAAEQVSGGTGSTDTQTSTVTAPIVHYNDLGEPLPEFRYDVPEPEEISPEILILKHF